MATLHEVTTATRKILAIGAMVGGGLLTLIILFNIARTVKEIVSPTPPPPPTVSFGQLPDIAFPIPVVTQKFSYSINTLTGQLPQFSDRAHVYKIDLPQPNLLALQKMQDIVNKVGFIKQPTALSDTMYQWTNQDNLPKELIANILTNDFSIKSNYTTDPTVLQSANLPDQDNAIATVQSFLTNMGIMPKDLDSGKTKASLFSIVNGKLTPATSLSTSQLIRVDLFQQDINKMQIYYPQPTYSTMYMYVAGGTTLPQIVEAKFIHQTITQDEATYPIKTASEAFQNLKDGKAYIASYDGPDNTITIRNVSLAYYLGETQQRYLMPIIVFQGDDGFFAYVSAVTDEWVKK